MCALAILFAVLVSAGDYFSGLVEETWRVKVLGQPSKCERLK